MGMILSKQMASLLAFEFAHKLHVTCTSYTEIWINFNFAEKYDELHLTILLFTWYLIQNAQNQVSFLIL